MFENNESYKYLGTAMFFLTALFIIFGLNIWIITLSLILFLGFSSWYLIYGKTDATYKFWDILGFAIYGFFFSLFLLNLTWLWIGSLGILWIFFAFIFFTLRLLNRWDARNPYANEENFTAYSVWLSVAMFIFYVVII